MPRINNIVLIPGAGWSDETGRFSRGVSVDAISEVDVVDLYLDPLAEYLDECNVRFEIAPTRKPPGIAESARLILGQPQTAQIELRVGLTRWDGDRRKCNESAVYYAGHMVKELAEQIAEALGEWGRCSCFGHREGAAREFDAAEGSIRIVPFCLNGPNASVYLWRLRPLGAVLGHAVVSYLGSTGQCQRTGPIRYPDRSGKQGA